MVEPDINCMCKHCGKQLEPNHIGPCPFCGKVGKTVFVTLYEKVSITDGLRITTTKQNDQTVILAGILILIIGMILTLNQITYSIQFDIFQLLPIAAFCIFVISLYLIINVIRRDSKRVNEFKTCLISSYEKKLNSSPINPKK